MIEKHNILKHLSHKIAINTDMKVNKRKKRLEE